MSFIARPPPPINFDEGVLSLRSPSQEKHLGRPHPLPRTSSGVDYGRIILHARTSGDGRNLLSLKVLLLYSRRTSVFKDKRLFYSRAFAEQAQIFWIDSPSQDCHFSLGAYSSRPGLGSWVKGLS